MARYAGSQIRNARLTKEILQIEKGKSLHGFHCKLIDEDGINYLDVKIPGPKETIYAAEAFDIRIHFDDLYPCSVPKLKFITPIYHPNIDKDGQICLNILNLPPNGAYNPTMSLESILMSVQLLLGNPNAYDPLRSDAAIDYRYNREIFDEKVKQQIELNKEAKEEAALTLKS